LKLSLLLLFIGLAFVGFTGNKYTTPTARAYFGGPPPGVTGAPGEPTCFLCHLSVGSDGQFTINAPADYTPGKTYQITVQHTTNNLSRLRWGFELTALNSSNTAAGTFANLSTNTQTLSDNGRFYIEHTALGTFPGQTNGASWTFNWTAPATDVGTVTFYAAGNQANNDLTPEGDHIFTATAMSQPHIAPPPNQAPFDFDGDGKTDVSIFRPGPTPAQWWLLRSSDGGNNAFSFGLGSDTPKPGDFTGDGKTDLAFFRTSSSEWFVLRSEDSTFFSFPFGATGDIPAPGDFDGDGTSDAAVYRPSTGTWFINRSSDGGVTITPFGIAEDRPVVADYDGDGMDDIAIFRPSNAQWWLNRSTDGVLVYQFGQAGDKTVQGDFTGDGKADAAFWRPSTGFWYVIRSEDQTFFGFPFGADGDVPVTGDYDGDGMFDAAVFRPSTNTWFINGSTSGVQILGFGSAGDVPLASVYSVP